MSVGIHAAWVVVFGRGRRMLPGWVALRMGRSPCGEKRFFFCGEAEVFYLAVGFCLLGWGVPLAGKPPFHLPARRGPKPLFLFREKKTAVLDSEKEKVDRWKSWGGAVQQDRLPMLRCCSSGERLWVSFCFRRLAFERPVVPLAPLPLSGWNTVTCSLVSTPPGWAVFGREASRAGEDTRPYGGWDGF